MIALPLYCADCSSDDLIERQLGRDTVKSTCVECGATCLTSGDWHEWASARTVRRAQAAEQDAMRRHESD